MSTQLKLRKVKFVDDFDNDSYTLLYWAWVSYFIANYLQPECNVEFEYFTRAIQFHDFV